jgi:glycosyltransferase involved in cell wall biosynthesis
VSPPEITSERAPASGEEPLVSVITVCYNPGPIVLEAIRSVQRQDYPAIEHIVVDGGSTGSTIEMIRDRLREQDFLISEPDDGIYDAMNKGIRRAKGSIIALLNADDRYAHDRIVSTFMDAFRARDVDCVLGDVAFFRTDPGAVVRRYNSSHFRPGRIRWGWMPAHPAMIVRRSVYERVGLYRNDYEIAADFEFVVRAFAKARVTYIHIPEVFVLMATGGVSTRGSRARRTINRESVRACRENGIYTNLPMIASKYAFKLLELVRW